MILPAPFGYEEEEYKHVVTVTGERYRMPVKLVPRRRPHEPVFLEWQGSVDGFTPDTCLVCGHDRYDEMHNPILYAEH